MSNLNCGVRSVLLKVKTPDSVHPGLWMNRYLFHQTWRDKGNEPATYNKVEAIHAKARLVKQVTGKPIPSGYDEALKRWQDGFQEETSVSATGEVLQRLAIGLGAKGAGEFGIHLHHTWGLPILPGSALKGIAALGAHRYGGENWKRRAQAAKVRPNGPNAYDALFGDVEEQGAVIFHDAWFVPANKKTNGIVRDVLTVHQPSYYQQSTKQPVKKEPSDTDSPVPVAFVSVVGSFHVVLQLHPSLDPLSQGGWLEMAWKALRLGLANHGIGSKTNAGYGRIELPFWNNTSIGLQAEKKRKHDEQEQFIGRRLALSPADCAEEVYKKEGSNTIKEWLKTKGQSKILGVPQEGVEPYVQAFAKLLKSHGVASKLTKTTHEDWKPFVSEALQAQAGQPKARKEKVVQFIDFNLGNLPPAKAKKPRKNWINKAKQARFNDDGCRIIRDLLQEDKNAQNSVLSAQAKKRKQTLDEFLHQLDQTNSGATHG